MTTGTIKMDNAGQAEKGSKRVVIEPLTRKERYNVKAEMILKRRDVAGTTRRCDQGCGRLPQWPRN